MDSESGGGPTLVLWDIDGTLVTTGSVSREVYARAFESVTGRALRGLADMTGRTERAIMLDTLALNGVREPEGLLDVFYEALGGAAERLRDRMRAEGRSLSGAGGAVAALTGDGVVQTVVTGNIRSIAVTKLRVFGLCDGIDFEVGGYGDESRDRAVLVRLACERAARAYGCVFVPDRIVVLGDTPHDVRGAHDAGVRAVGVATGHSTAADLAAAGADAVLADLVDATALRAAVFEQRRADLDGVTAS